MKKVAKIITTLIAFAMAGGLSACGVTANNEGGNNTKPTESSKGIDKSSITDPGKSANNPSKDPVALSDSVLYSHNRLKNADFSFNFSMSTGKKSSNKNLKKNLGEEEQGQDWTIDEDKNIDFTFPEGDVYTREQFDYFKDKTQQLDALRSTALNMVDFAINNISILDKRVEVDNFTYCLSYDAEKDIISLYRENPSFDVDCVIFIELYYNEEGLETVHYEQTVKGDYEEYFDLYYIPNYYYYFAQKGGPVGPGMQWLSVASKTNGSWKGLQFYFDDENPVISKKGEYDYGNRQILPYFLIEQDGEFFTFSDTVVPTRNGRETWSGVEAQEEDGIELQRYGAEGEWGFYEAKAGVISIDMDKFSTIKSVHFDHQSFYGYNGSTFYHPYFDEHDSYLTLKNGKLVKNGLSYNAKYGLAYANPGEGVYILEDGTRVSYDDYETTCTARFAGGEAYLNEGQPFGTSYPIRFSCQWDKYEISECFEAISGLLDAVGLVFKQGIDPEVMSKLAYLEKYSDVYRGQLFEKIMGTQYSAEAIFQLAKDLLHASDTRPDIIRGAVGAIEKVDASEMPPVKGNSGAILPTLLSDADISMEVDMTNKKLVITNPSLKVNKTIVLHEGEKYTVKLIKDGEIVEGEFFSTETYHTEDITFSLLENAPKLDLPTEEGTHSYFARVYRIVDDIPQFPASKDLLLKVKDFEEFKIVSDDMETLGGNTEYAYANSEGVIELAVKFIDLTAPTIDFGIISYEEGELHFNRFLDYEMFKNLVTVKDNYDKCLLTGDIKFYKDDAEEPLEIGLSTRLKEYADGSTIHFVIYDASGNKTDVAAVFVEDEVSELPKFIIEIVRDEEGRFVEWETLENFKDALGKALIMNIPDNVSFEIYSADDTETLLGFFLEESFIDQELCIIFNDNTGPLSVRAQFVEKSEQTETSVGK